MAKGKRPRTADVCRELALAELERLGLELWDIRFEKEGGDWYLRYFIDKEGGVSIADCEAFSRAVEPLLDQADPIEQSYVLEVSSPGVERRLTREEHFARYLGRQVRIRLIRPLTPGGVRDLCGALLEKTSGELRLRSDSGEELAIPAGNIAAAKLLADF